MRFALLTCDPLPEPDPDEVPLLAALRVRGHNAEPVVWDAPSADFSAYDALVLRATWDYAAKAARFGAWLDRPEVAARLVNPAEAVRWNLDKRYLLELESRGVPIVPTAVGGPGESIAEIAHGRGWRDIVVKPVVSAGSANTARFSGDALADADGFVRSWATDAAAMVQPYLRSVEGGDAGQPERALVCIGGEVSHAVVKSRRFAGDDESVRAHGSITDEERTLASRVLDAGRDACGSGTLYARVDVMQDNDGRTVLSELELIEPSLFFGHAPGSADGFADALEAWVSQIETA